MSAPRLTLGVPVYNGERYLAETLESLLAQDFDDFELLVSDNASTDATVRIVEAFGARDPRVRLLRSRTNRGAAANYNRLVDEARGTLFKWASADDLLEPTYLSRCVDLLDGNRQAVLAYPKTLLVDEQGALLREHEDGLHLPQGSAVDRLRQFATKRNLCNACFGVIRTDVLRATGLVRPTVSSDITLLAELALAGPFLEVPERLFRRRVARTSCGLGDLTPQEVATWFDPARRAPRVPPLVRVFFEIELAIGRSTLPPPERVHVAAAFGTAWVKRRLGTRIWKRRMARAGGPLPAPGRAGAAV